MTSGDAADSLCPKGWALPINSDNYTDKSYKGLLTNPSTYNLSTDSTSSNIMRQSTLAFTFSRQYSTAGTLESSVSGQYWIATAGSPQYGRRMTFNLSRPYWQLDLEKSYGLSVRCVKK